MPYALWTLIGYVFGSIPFAVIIAKARGVDIFKVGSKSPGATNVTRSVGKMEGRLCFALDALKGFIPVLIALLVSHNSILASLALLGALLGHSFSVWIKFRGGKGVATTIGGLFALAPATMLVGLLVWGVVFYIFRYVSLASILMAVWLPFGALFFHMDLTILIIVSILAALVVLRHKANIKRLLTGTENRFNKNRTNN